MFKKISICGALLVLSCAAEENPSFHDADMGPDASDVAQLPDDDVWVCYSPGSQFHGKQCDEKQEPGQCLTNGDSSKFCWRLDLEECISNPRDLLYNEICEHF